MAALQILYALCGREVNALGGHFAAHEHHQKWLGALLLKPATNVIVGRITSLFLAPYFKIHYTFLEDQLEAYPDRGQFLCGKHLTAADVLMSFPLEASQTRSGTSQGDFPLL